MRSKEVELAIKIFKNTNFEKYTYSCKKCSLEDYKNCYTENCHDKSKDTLLNYISELEKDTVSKSVIKDKIKELLLKMEQLQIQYSNEIHYAYKTTNLGQQKLVSEQIKVLNELLKGEEE